MCDGVTGTTYKARHACTHILRTQCFAELRQPRFRDIAALRLYEISDREEWQRRVPSLCVCNEQTCTCGGTLVTAMVCAQCAAPALTQSLQRFRVARGKGDDNTHSAGHHSGEPIE